MATFQCSICGKKSSSIPPVCPLCGQEGADWIDLSTGESKIVRSSIKKRTIIHKSYKKKEPKPTSTTEFPPLPDITHYFKDDESVIEKIKDDYVYLPGYMSHLKYLFSIMYNQVKLRIKWEISFAIIIGILTQGWVFINSTFILWLTIFQMVIVVSLSAQEWFKIEPIWYVPYRFYEIFALAIGTSVFIYLLSYPARLFI